MKPTYFKEKEAAEYLGVGYSTLRKWRYENVGPVYRRLGRSIRYSRSALDRHFKRERIKK